MKYASRTQVPVSRSRSQIEETVLRYGADQFGSALDNENERAMVQFRLTSWLVRFILPLSGASDQQARQRWRALLLVIKAKLEAVESGITTVEEEFLSHIVVPGGHTFGEWAVPQLRDIKERGQLPKTILTEIEDQREKR